MAGFVTGGVCINVPKLQCLYFLLKGRNGNRKKSGQLYFFQSFNL